MLIVGEKYKLSDGDIAIIKKEFISYSQINVDKNTEKQIKKVVANSSKVTIIVLNLETKLSQTLKNFLEDLEANHKIKTLLFLEFVQQYLGQYPLEMNEENLKTLLDIQDDRRKKFTKRLFDISFSVFAIVVASPLLLIITILIKLKSPEGAIFFTQKRLGYAGKKFRVFKFRTMIPNAEEVLEQMLNEDEEIRNEYLKYRKLKKDPRIIPVIGDFLRKSSLDELPQFFNVLLGDMSVVGPRPYIEEEFYKHTQTHIDIITSVKPGVTGYWQVTDRNAATFNGRVDSDIEYIKTQNLLLDLKIIFQTIIVMVFRRGS